VPVRRSVDRLVLTLAGALLTGLAVLPPATYYLLLQQHRLGSLETEAEEVARQVDGVVSANPDMWRFEQVRLAEQLERRAHADEPEVRRVLDAEGRVVAESLEPLAPPVAMRSAPILDAGAKVGRVEVLRSLRPAALAAALLAALLVPLSLVSFLLLRGYLHRVQATRLGLEERLRQSNRLEAIGRLAGGVAHDFNNLLAAVLGFARELREELPPDSPQQEAVGEILSASLRGVQVTKSLLAFSRQQALDLKRADAGDLVRGLERLLARTLGEAQTLRLALAAEPLPVEVDLVQLEMVLVNLVANARDAMAPGGTLSVSAARLELGRDEATAAGLARPGGYARIAVRDTGAGMDELTRQRVFDPFFTTKAVGKGTGLGLAIAHGVLQQHGGSIQVESAPGLGSTFAVLLPLEAAAAAAPVEARQPITGPPPGGQETILIAEDDRFVRKVLRRQLVQAGYQVIEAADGDEAVRQFGQHRADLELLVLDVNLPGRSGPEALRQIRQVAPSTRALFVSGNPAEAGDALADEEVLLKPVEPAELLFAVRRAIDG
jgi:signal transduction histidine kinase/CheY-like chemotaxis protein